jgi:hypothetical protein
MQRLRHGFTESFSMKWLPGMLHRPNDTPMPIGRDNRDAVATECGRPCDDCAVVGED